MDSSRTVQLVATLFLYFAVLPSVLAAETAAKHRLETEHAVGELTRVEVAFQVGGDLKLVIDGQEKSLPMSVVANLKYDEQVLRLGDGGRPNRSVRYYDDTRAVIKVDQGGEKPTLDPRRRLIAVDKPAKGSPVLYCPAAPLLREELDLIDVPGGSLLIDELLPATPVALGESWKLTDESLASLLCLDAVSWSDVSCVLGEITNGVGEVAAAGSVNGAVGGISTEIELKAKFRFEFNTKRLSYLALLIKETRAVGHVGPGLDTVAKLIMSVKPIETSQYLTPQRVATVPESPLPGHAELAYQAASGQFHFLHDRRWHLTSDDDKLTILRYLDRGELVAQCNISLLPGVKESPTTLAEFQRDIQKSLGKSFGQFTNASQSQSEAGYHVLRATAHGIVAELPIEWVYYLIQDSDGKRVTLAFTYEQDLAERFAQADRLLAAQVRLTQPPAPTAAKPVKQQ